MAEKVYLSKPDVYECDVKILMVDGNRIVIDPEVFYPLGGGQPADQGHIILNNGESYGVTSVEKGGLIFLDRPLPEEIRPGTLVHAKVDHDTRNIHKRLHTALHVLNATVFQQFRARVTGAQIHSDGTARMDFNLPDVPSSRIRELEADLKEIISKDLPVIEHYLPREEAMKLPGAVRTENRDIPPGPIIRVVEIRGLDQQACGGTHVSSTGKVGLVAITGVDNKGRGNRRVKIKLMSQQD